MFFWVGRRSGPLQEALLDLRVLCVGVHCQPEVGEAREQARGDA
ncbi:hypothetical protein D3875_20330 [Deinococcus cavernae]|uniref:Uncharacterized protein n=1 Tax=Deinococcus cavernae TaxID=2320857 RepID=A0A418V1U1_9DEIO|nr:hypothetical protein D3875_20330 [Deinococcus cavernae]